MNDRPKGDLNSAKEGLDNDTSLKKAGIITIVIIVVLWACTHLLFLVQGWGASERGTYGDMFGSINSLFSGLALAGIIFTILLQRKELSLQREELAATRLEFTTQNRTLRLQRFENTFFNLLSLHHQIVEGIDVDSKILEAIDYNTIDTFRQNKRKFINTTLKGRDVFKEKYDHLILYINHFKEKGIDMDLNTTYLDMYEEVQTDFGHYFRNLYRIIKFVDETEFSSREELGVNSKMSLFEQISTYNMLNQRVRYEYTSMVRAQLSDYELLWLFYNCLSELGSEKFKPLVEKYALLKNIPESKVHDSSLLMKYDRGAFKLRQ